MASDDSRWENVTFKIIDESLDARVIDFIFHHFHPDEPICRSLHINRDDLFEEGDLKETLKDRCSLAALDNQGQILAVRLGKVARKSDWTSRFIMILFYIAIKYCCCCCLGQETRYKFNVLFKLFERMDYDVYNYFSKYNCTTIYDDKGLASARSHGIRGLGTELTKRAEDLSRQRGCTHACALATGKYSIRVFEKLGYTALNRLVYNDFRDKNGELYLKDTREHTEAIAFIKEY